MEEPELLTPSQEKTLEQLIRISNFFPLVVIQGERESGKHTLISKFLKNSGKQVISINICRLSLQNGNPLQPGNFYQHLISQVNNQKRDKGWIYIRHWDKIREIIEDYGNNYRYFPKYALSRFSEEVGDLGYKIIVSTENNPGLDTSCHWIIKHENDAMDIREYMRILSLTKEEIEILFPMVSKARLGQIKQIVTYCEAFPRSEINKHFGDAVIKVCGSTLNPELTITQTQPDVNLIGMEEILEEIERSIIHPMSLGLDDIPLKKGIVLAGAPGTGKTSIGRWLARRLLGRLYLVDGTVGVNGDSLISAVVESLDSASKNAPSVVFIDDVDLLFENPDTYRSFLTLLDGVENKRRGGICVIVTCMDISKIPSSLIRGGRLELCIQTNLPKIETRKKILTIGFQKINKLLQTLERDGKIKQGLLQSFIDQSCIDWIASQMNNWNCADIQRSLDDILRFLLSYRGESFNLREIAKSVISTIRHQYELVKRPEDRPDMQFYT